MSGIDHNCREQTSECASAARRDASGQRINPRPQRMHSWFNLIPVKKFEDTHPDRVTFLDSFVTVTPKSEVDAKNFTVLFEGKEEMSVVVEYGVIFVWYGDNLLKPDRPFPKIFAEPYSSQYVSSKVSEFENTHIMDFVENGSDNLHFKVVHLWESSKMYDHKISEDTITLQQDIKMCYGASTTNRFARFIARLLPILNLHHDYVYHGPGLATVSASGLGNIEFHSLVSLTPEGEHGTRLYVTIALEPSTFPKWLERMFKWVSPKRALCDIAAGIMANFVQNEFHMDAVIWANKSYQDLNLLPSEKHLQEVRLWGERFYPKDFVAPELAVKSEDDFRWEYLDEFRNIKEGEIRSYSVSGEDLVAYKDHQGGARVFDAYCSHQGAHLGHGGKLEDGCLRCPFHGFYFDKEGQCLGPSAENKTKIISDINLTAIKHRVENGRVEVFV